MYFSCFECNRCLITNSCEEIYRASIARTQSCGSDLDVSLQRLTHDDLKHVQALGVIGCYGDRLQQLVVERRFSVFRRILVTRRVTWVPFQRFLQHSINQKTASAYYATVRLTADLKSQNLAHRLLLPCGELLHIFSRPYWVVRLRLWYDVLSVCRLSVCNVLCCG